MKRILLFSQPVGPHMDKIAKFLFPKELENKIMAYMPTNGHQSKQEYTKYWQELAEKNYTRFLFIDNLSSNYSSEKEKLYQANILLISGGNTFELLHNLRKSKLDQAIKDFSKRDEYVLAGFSAGAIVLSPTIAVASQPAGDDPDGLMDENLVGLTDLTGLNIISFEVFPHFNPEKDEQNLKNYQTISSNAIKPITDEGHIVLDLEQH